MNFLKRHSFIMGLILILVVTGGVMAGNVARRTKNAETIKPVIAHVTLVSVAEYAKDKSTVSADGSVESLNQAVLRSQVNAPIVKITAAVGNKVVQGQLLATLQNADVAAQLAQAQAGLKAQESRLAEVKKGSRTEDLQMKQTSLAQARQNLQNLYDNTVTVLSDAYAKADDAVRKQTWSLFTNPEDPAPQLTFQVKDSQIEIDAESQRGIASRELNAWQKEISDLAATPSGTNSELAIQSAKGHLNLIRSFINRATDAVQAQLYLTNATVDGYKFALTTAKSEVNGAVSAVTAAEQGIAAQKLVINQTTSQLSLTQAGATPEQISTQEAAVEQARASVQALEVQIGKTYIRAPIDGTVSDVPVRVGELLTVGTPILSIVNVNGLQVKAFVSDYDRARLSEGATVAIGDNATGTVARISPSLDPQNKKVEVDVLVVNPKTSGLVIGQNVNIKIAAATQADTSFFLVPIQAVQVTSEGSFVYFVNATSSTLTRHPVAMGRVVGESVEVKDGLTPDMKIVGSVQELRDGQTVIVDQ